MYDQKREPREFVAETREEAIAQAARFFGVDASELRVSNLDDHGVYGLGARVVVVAAPATAPRVARGGGGGDDGGGRS